MSIFSNLVLDLQDFRDRVRPLARDISLMDQSRAYQNENVGGQEEEIGRLRKALDDIERDDRNGVPILRENEEYRLTELETSGDESLLEDGKHK